MTRSIRFVFFVAAAATFAADAGAGIPAAPASSAAPDPGVLKVSESVEYHDVDARTLEEFVEALRARPAGDDEAGAAARTRAALQVGYKLVPDDAGCRVVGLGVQLDVVMHLPRWQPPEGLRPAIRGQWERMKTGIELHEQGHRDIALDAGRFLAERLEAVPTAGRDCDAVGRAILRERIKAQMRHQNIDAQYDQRTRHGLAQAPKAPDDEDEGPRRVRDFRDRGEGRDLSDHVAY